MATKQLTNSLMAPDGSQYVTLTDGAGNLVPVAASGAPTTITTGSDGLSTVAGNSQLSASENYIFNGSTWDRVRSLNGYNQAGQTGAPVAVLVPNNDAKVAIASTATSVAAGSLILKASAGNLYSVCVNAGASAGYLMVFDSATVPADGVVTPVFSIPVAANGFYTTDWAYPIRGSAGLTLVFSTTGPFTKTISATAFLSGQFI